MVPANVTANAVGSGQNTAMENAVERRLKESCTVCGVMVLPSNMARHQKSQRCAKASNNTAQPCPVCGEMVKSSYLTRHQKTKKCTSANNAEAVQPVREPCPVCGVMVMPANLKRHQKSKKCTTAANDTETVQPMKENCSVCGLSILPSHMARHQKSKKCTSGSNNTPTVPVQKKPCSICGIPVAPSNMSRHQKSKKCATASKNTASGETSIDTRLRDIGMQPSLKSVTCFLCEENVEATHWSRHCQSQKHKHFLMTEMPQRTLEEMLSLNRSYRLPTPTPDIAKLTQKYPKKPIERRRINRITNDIDEHLVTRKPTRPLKPNHYNIQPSTSEQSNELEDIINEFKNIPPPISPLPLEENDDRFQQSIDDFDLSLLDDVPPQDSDLFQPPTRVNNPDSERIRESLGPSLYEQQLLSPAYQSPLHFPPSPTYQPLSPKYFNVNLNLDDMASYEYDLIPSRNSAHHYYSNCIAEQRKSLPRPFFDSPTDGNNELKKKQLEDKRLIDSDELKKKQLEDKTLIDSDELKKKQVDNETLIEDINPFMGFDDDIFTPARDIRSPPYVINETKSRYIKKYGTTEVDYTIRVNKPMEIENAINAMIKQAKSKGHYQKGDKITIVASHPMFNHDISVVVKSDIKAREFMDHVSNILSSNEEMNITQTTFNIKIINIPRGAKGKYVKIINLAEDIRTKRCITQIKNTDNLCCPRAVVTALTYHWDNILDKPVTKQEIKLIRQGYRLQGVLAKELCKRLGEYNEDGFTLEDIRNVEKLLNIQIKVVCAENFNSIIYKGDPSETTIYLYKRGNHFDVINSMRALLGSCYYCDLCDTKYNNKGAHKCKNQRVCNMCMRAAHEETYATVYCDKCNRYCYNDECLGNHNDVCEKIFKCLTCKKVCNRNKEHSCFHFFCHNCKEVAKYNEHECYIQQRTAKGGVCGCNKCLPNSLEPPNKKCTYTEKYLFFDYEAMQDTGVHEANLIKVHDFKGQRWTFFDNDSFCKWLISKNHRGYTCIAHYAKGYDSYFILRYCVENTLKPYTIYTGTKLMLLQIPGFIKIIDSMNFVASPLAAFPKTFGLKELKKGYFPHFFNTPENQTYVGPIPNVNYYGADTMKPDARKEFLKWHADRLAEGYKFDFKKELEEYCDSDVDILRRGCLELRKQFLEIANIDPFCYLTIASVCMAIYRSLYLQPKTIAVINNEQKEQFSKQSITWLETFPGVRHALNGGEVTICGSKVDGYQTDTNTVYQYHGCFWHGCLRCYKTDTINNVKKESMGDLYNKTLERTEQIKRAGYEVIEMWECDWVPSYKKIGDQSKVNIVESLKPRDAFFGGRTNAVKLKVSGKKIRYIDVVSLYPTVMFYDNYPIGHPIKYKKPKRYNPDWFGLIKCKVIAPRGLYHPVLPVKKDKLLFPLCVKCAEEKIKVCKHTDEQRAFDGTWTTIEINKAIEKGYKLLNIYEVWHFKQRSNDLFKGYIQDFMKIKLETSPWQKDYNTKEDYAAATKEGMGIELDICKIEDNPGKRAVAKICLNSLWGKFGQRLNMTQTRYVTEASEFYNILLDDTLNTTNISIINDNIVQVSYSKKDYYVENSNSVNEFVAAYTTSNARLRLYDMLDRIGTNVVDFDTDSIFYIDDGTNTVETGCMLGQWSNELGKDDYITDFVSTGPKSRAYETAHKKGAVKIKGFTLNYKNSQKLNMDTMKQVLEGTINNVMVEYNQITRDTATKHLVNKSVTKGFTIDYDKRFIVPEINGIIDSLPWGY